MIGDILSSILSMFREGSQFRRERSEHRDAALDAIYMACTETKLYASDWERTGKRSRKREQELARLWKKASIPVRHYDKMLADKCYHKGEYWLDPDHWDDGQGDCTITYFPKRICARYSSSQPAARRLFLMPTLIA